ncbi:NPH3 domain [Sesbania bispinosa]|nr:NPH3 domain [Sesbania bispinosa]
MMEITPSNVALLCSAAHFLEMECDDGLGTPNLKPHIENFLEGIRFWTWSELLEALKQCQDLFTSQSYFAILDRIVDHLIERVASPCNTSPHTCSSNRSSFQFSCDSSSNNSWRNNCSGATWWFEHLLFLKIDLLDKVIRTMISRDFDHGIVSKFLFYYHNSSCLGAAQAEKIEATKVIINLLSLLDVRSLSCKDLFNLYRSSISLKTSICCKNKIESLIGPLLDQATIDYLLLPSPRGRDHAYDVDFVLRLIHIFFSGGSFELTLNRLKRVVNMVDLFLVEVAPDPHLKPCEFEALITVLPDTARESHDQLYLAMDMYLKVHAGLGDKEKMSICCTLNHEKLSAELLRHLTRNLVFPSEAKPRAHVTRQSRMKTLLQENDHLKNFFDSMFRKSFKNIDVKEGVDKRIYDAEELRLSTGVQKLGGDLEGGTQLASVKKSGIHIMSNAMYLPKLCS